MSRGEEYGPCVVCGDQSCGATACTLCPPEDQKRYANCHEHHDEIRTLIKGHVLRNHPESIPDVIDKLVRDPVAVANIRLQATRNPALWSQLLAHIDARVEK